MKKEFNIESYKKYDKDIQVNGPGDLRLTVDFDDVDQKSVEEKMNKMINILNDHWNDKKYSKHAEDLMILDFEKWFVNKFYEISEEHGNSESIEEIEIVGKDPMIITFSVDCDRRGVHRNNTVRITKDKKVIMNLDEVIEGGDLEVQFKRAIEEKINGKD